MHQDCLKQCFAGSLAVVTRATATFKPTYAAAYTCHTYCMLYLLTCAAQQLLTLVEMRCISAQLASSSAHCSRAARLCRGDAAASAADSQQGIMLCRAWQP